MATDNLRRSHVLRPLQFFFGGEWVEPSSDRTFDIIDSASEEVFMTVAEAQPADVERAVTAARAAFDRGPWPRMAPAERAVYLKRIAEACATRAGALADTWTSESGVLRSMSQYAAAGVAGVFNYYAGLAEGFAWEERHTTASGEPAILVREPVGVVVAIIPWNAANSLLAYKVAPALIAGCTVIIKASPEAPAAPLLFAEICEEIGLPAGVVNVLTADREVSEILVRDPRIDKVSFTGSTAAGRKIASICGDRIARVTLELGG
jgi:aldehyde dehydrogenase (NAD+)